jgi:hypothetical protein
MVARRRIPGFGTDGRAASGADAADTLPAASRRGWTDLLEAGAFDLVGEPYRRERIQRVIADLALYARAPLAAVP